MNTTPTSTSRHSSRIMHFLRFIQTLDHVEVILFLKIYLSRKHDQNRIQGLSRVDLSFVKLTRGYTPKRASYCQTPPDPACGLDPPPLTTDIMAKCKKTLEKAFRGFP